MCNKKCAICPYVRDTETFSGFDWEQYNVKNYVNCTTAIVLYALFCKHCDQFIYVGRNRWYFISTTFAKFIFNKKAKTRPGALHFKFARHSLEDYEIVPLEKICENDFSIP